MAIISTVSAMMSKSRREAKAKAAVAAKKNALKAKQKSSNAKPESDNDKPAP